MNEAYSKGKAVGIQQIRTDSVFFRFNDETFEFPTNQVIPEIATFNGSYYEADVKKLRQLRRMKEKVNGKKRR